MATPGKTEEAITTLVGAPDYVATKSSHVRWSTLPRDERARWKRCDDCGGLGLVARSTRYTKVHDDGTVNGHEHGEAICRRCDGTGLNLIRCQSCDKRELPAREHSVFCSACAERLDETADKPADVSADDLFATIARNNRRGY